MKPSKKPNNYKNRHVSRYDWLFVSMWPGDEQATSLQYHPAFTPGQLGSAPADPSGPELRMHFCADFTIWLIFSVHLLNLLLIF